MLFRLFENISLRSQKQTKKGIPLFCLDLCRSQRILSAFQVNQGFSLITDASPVQSKKIITWDLKFRSLLSNFAECICREAFWDSD